MTIDDMKSLKSLLIAAGFAIFGIVYVISPIDLLPGIPIDDIVVSIASLIGTIKSMKNCIETIPRSLNLVAILLIVLIIVIISCLIFK